MLICPVCGEQLVFSPSRAVCCNCHSFDVAKEGYVNLLRSGKSGDMIGDDKTSARRRRDFLNKGYYQPLADALCTLLRDQEGNLLDICCGEGYYTSQIRKKCKVNVYGFDISKEMVRLAAKRSSGVYFVANMASIPVADEAFDVAIHLFAPFKESEFARILKKSGTLYSVIPRKSHLYGLKQALYDTPYFNDEKLPPTQQLELIQTHRVRASICLHDREDIESVFRMTPYYFHTSQRDKEKLALLECLETDIEFLIAEYRKTGDVTYAR